MRTPLISFTRKRPSNLVRKIWVHQLGGCKLARNPCSYFELSKAERAEFPKKWAYRRAHRPGRGLLPSPAAVPLRHTARAGRRSQPTTLRPGAVRAAGPTHGFRQPLCSTLPAPPPPSSLSAERGAACSSPSCRGHATASPRAPSPPTMRVRPTPPTPQPIGSAGRRRGARLS